MKLPFLRGFRVNRKCNGAPSNDLRGQSKSSMVLSLYSLEPYNFGFGICAAH